MPSQLAALMDDLATSLSALEGWPSVEVDSTAAARKTGPRAMLYRDSIVQDSEALGGDEAFIHTVTLKLDLEAQGAADTRSALIDEFMLSLGVKLNTDRSLGGACLDIRFAGAEFAVEAPEGGGKSVSMATITLIADYQSSNPLL